jgi:hypothetical protein
MIDESMWSTGEMINDKGITQYPGKSLSLCYFFHDKSHMDCLGSEIGENIRKETQQGSNDGSAANLLLTDITEKKLIYRQKHQIRFLV